MVNAEYRTRLVGALDGVVFYEAGSVAPSMSALAKGRLKTDYGAGLRIHSPRHLLVRLDVARGSEGLQTVVSFTPSLDFARRIAAPYVP
jgi:outer membrane translocation and assembly module TamA